MCLCGCEQGHYPSDTEESKPKKYKVVCYIRVESEDMEPMTYDEAKAEADNLRLMQPENEYRIVRIK